MPYQTLIIDFPDPFIARVSLNRPQSANALNTPMGNELAAVFKDLAKRGGNARVVVLTGEGKHFCAGADLKQRHGMTEKAWHAQHRAFEKALAALLDCPLPVIAAVNGAAMGGGLELALACDFIFAAETARFALPEVTLGIMPGLGGTQTLPRAIGLRRAKAMLFLGRVFSAEEAYRLGLVSRLVQLPSLMPESLSAARTIAHNAPLAIRAVKKAVNQGIAKPLRASLQGELTQYKRLLKTRDRQEGINAFNEKRKPVFTGA